MALASREAVRADGCIVMAHGTPEKMARARAILDVGAPSRIDMLYGLTPDRPNVSRPLLGDAAGLRDASAGRVVTFLDDVVLGSLADG